MDDKREQATLPDVASVFRQFFATLAPDKASLQFDEQRDGEVYVRLIPANPEAAAIAARGGGQRRYELLVGRGTPFEIVPPRGPYAQLPPAEEVRAICTAVISGNFREVVWTVGKTVTKTLGMLKLGDRTIQIKISHSILPSLLSSKKVFEYRAY